MLTERSRNRRLAAVLDGVTTAVLLDGGVVGASISAPKADAGVDMVAGSGRVGSDSMF